MKRKIFILLCFIVLCTGCSVKYTLEINDDLSVKEEIIALENKEFYDIYYKSTISRVIDLVMSKDRKYLTDNNYSVTKIIEEKSGVKITNNFFDFDEYYEISEFDTQLFSSFDYQKKNGVIVLDASGSMIRESDVIEKYIIDDAIINIKVPFKVIDNNADNYNYVTNTYSWIIDEDTESKNIHIEFDTNKKIITFDSIKKYILIILIFGIIIGSYIFINNKKRKNNII